MELALDKTKDYQIYWVDSLKARFHNWLPYRCGVAIGYQEEDCKRDVVEIFRKYLIRTKSIPDMSSGRRVETNGEVYYYIECHNPSLWRFLYPIDYRVDWFVTSLKERFAQGDK